MHNSPASSTVMFVTPPVKKQNKNRFLVWTGLSSLMKHKAQEREKGSFDYTLICIQHLRESEPEAILTILKASDARS